MGSNVNLQKAKILSLLCCETYENETKIISKKSIFPLRDKQIIKHSDPTVPLLALSGILDEELIIAFRGTVIADKEQPLKNWQHMVTTMICNFLAVADNPLYASKYNTKAYAGMVHPGFAWLLEEFLPDIENVIKNSNAKQICLTGHSLGGALATLAAYRLINTFPVNSVYTFGSPRVGDKDFRSQYKITHFRFENRNDIVPHVPPYDQHRDRINNLLLPFIKSQLPAVNYQHVGTLQFINWEGNLVEDSTLLREERLNEFVKNPNEIFNDHNISLYFQALENLIKAIVNYSEESGVNMQSSLNILTIGKTGAGKSSLINYLYGEDIAKAGIGSPVTQGGFDKYQIKWEDINVQIYDSVGLEVGNGMAKSWEENLNSELKEHGIERQAIEWFHAVFYCINAGGHRVEPYEEGIIEKLILNKYRLIIVVTNSDQATDKEIDQLIQPIRRKFTQDIAPVVPVCSVTRELRDGSVSRTFGRSPLQSEMLKGFWYAITVRLPDRCAYLLHQEVDKWMEKQTEIISSHTDKTGRLHKITKEKLIDQINDNLKIFQGELDNLRIKILKKEITETVRNFAVIANKLQYPQSEDFPKLPTNLNIPPDFISQVKKLLLSFGNFFATILARLVGLFDSRSPQDVIKNLENEMLKLKNIITEQNPQISELVEGMLRTEVNENQ
ncbi:MAG: lipase family protein [Cuspidothrix sp.]